MARSSQIGVEKYLGLSFEDRPEPDYVHGEVVERALPAVLHSRVKGLLALFFEPLSKRVRLTMMLGLRLQIEPRLFRIVDFAIYLGARPAGRYATTPAFVTLEIVSEDDCFVDVTERLEDYRRWGVPHVWLVDPQLKRLYEYTEAGLLQYPSLRLPEFDFEISAQELFKDL
jgi:Uma2 family endonuclease